MVEIEFDLKQNKTIIQANLSDPFQVVIKKFCEKAKIAPNSAFFLAKGKPINPIKTVESHMSSSDKQEKKFRVLVDLFENDDDKKPKIIKSKEIICPKCKEPCRFTTVNFKIKLFDCVNSHVIDKIKIIDFPKTQEINLSEILCGQCKKKNKGQTQRNEFYRCLYCNINLCILCKSNHNLEHGIIKYDSKNFICPKHSDTFIKYCEQCHINICFSCDDDHYGHRRLSLMEIKPDIKKAKERLEDLKKEIGKLINLNTIIRNSNELAYIIQIMNIYYEINNDILKNYEAKYRNYQLFQNIKEVYNNNEIFEALKKINNYTNIEDIIAYILNLKASLEKVRDLNKIKIIYDIGYDNIIKLFGKNFVNNNKNNCYLLINMKKFELCETIRIKDKKNLTTLEIKLIETKPFTNMSYMFHECYSLKSLPDISEWDTRNVTDMSYMFYYCCSLKYLPDISKWNTKNVKNLSNIFSLCNSLKCLPDISRWDTRNVFDMSFMFHECISLESLPDISKWDTRNVTDMNHLFCGCNSLKLLPDISKWDTSNVTNMNSLFNYCIKLTSLPDIEKWNTKNVIDKKDIINECNFLKEESKSKILEINPKNRIIIFKYLGNNWSLQCFSNEKLIDVFRRFCSKAQIPREDVRIYYNSSEVRYGLEGKTLEDLGVRDFFVFDVVKDKIVRGGNN